MGDQGNTDSPRKYEVINETNTARYSLFWDLNQDVVFDYTASLGHSNECRSFRSSALSFPGAKSPQMELSFPWNFRSVETTQPGQNCY